MITKAYIPTGYASISSGWHDRSLPLNRQYDEAMEYHSWALSLQPHNASTLTAMGFVCALQSRPIEAVDYFHQALGLRPEDTFAQHMLTQIIDSSNENGVPG